MKDWPPLMPIWTTETGAVLEELKDGERKEKLSNVLQVLKNKMMARMKRTMHPQDETVSAPLPQEMRAAMALCVTKLLLNFNFPNVPYT